MRAVVVPLGDPDLREGAVRAVARQEERADPGGVRLEGERQQVVHQVHVLAVVPRDPRGGGGGRLGQRAKALRVLKAHLDFAHAREVLVELVLVARVELALQAPRVVQHEIEQRFLRPQPRLVVSLALLGGARAEEALKHEPRIGLGRHRRGRRLPGDVVLVRARVARVAVARLVHRVAGQLERREPRDVPDMLGRDLVDGHADVDVAPVGLARAGARQERRVGARVVAPAVVARLGLVEVEPSDDLELAAKRGEGLHGAPERKIRALPRRPPVFLVRAIGKIHERHPQRRAGGRGGRPGGPRRGRTERRGKQRLEHGKTEADADPLEEQAAAERQPALGGRVPARFIGGGVHRDYWVAVAGEPVETCAANRGGPTGRRLWNGGESITPSRSVENRPSSRSSPATMRSTDSTS